MASRLPLYPLSIGGSASRPFPITPEMIFDLHDLQKRTLVARKSATTTYSTLATTQDVKQEK